MSIIPDYKTLTELLKKGLTLEAQEQIMALREAAVELKSENSELKSQILELKRKLEIKEKILWEAPYYFLQEGEKKDGPYCQHCYDNSDKKLIRLQQGGKGIWDCLACGNVVHDRDYVTPSPRGFY